MISTFRKARRFYAEKIYDSTGLTWCIDFYQK